MASKLKLTELLYPTSTTPAITINPDNTVTFGASTTTITNLAYTGTLTGGTGVINIGSGQIYKAANGKVGIGTTSPGAALQVSSTSAPGVLTTYDTNFYSRTNLQLTADGSSSTYGSLTDIYRQSASDNYDHSSIYVTYNGYSQEGTGASSSVYDIYNVYNSTNFHSGSAQQLYGVYNSANIGSYGTAAVTDLYGIYNAVTVGGSGTLTNYYGIYLNTPSGTIANKFSLYSNDANSKLYHAGNVGIGTSAPLSYAGYKTLTINDTTGSNIELTVGGTRTAALTATTNTMTFYGLGASTPLVFNTNASERMRITSAGNVGIGTASPATRLHTFIENAGTPTTSGSATTGVSARFQNSSVNMDFGTYADGTCFIQPRLAGNNASNFNLVLQPNGGSVGIGTASPSSYGKFAIGLSATGSATNNVIGIYQSAGADAAALRIAGFNYAGNAQTAIDFIQNSASNFQSQIAFSTNGGGGIAERVRIDANGNLLVNATSGFGNGGKVEINGGASGNGLNVKCASTGFSLVCFNDGGVGLVYFTRTGGASVGTITTDGTGTAYNTTSDYRLKENVAPMTGALAKVAQLKPCTYTWKADGSAGQGFIAHELQEVVPDCVTGKKDAVDENGNPKYQGVDTSFLVATLTAAIQEQQAIIETLQTRLTALEGN